jgi:hypothetical protein
MPAPTPKTPPQGNGICVTTSRSDFDYFLLHNQNIPATICSESVIGSPFEQTISNYLDGSTDLEYEFDDLEVLPTAQQNAINQINQMLGGAPASTPPKTQEVDFDVPTDYSFPIDFKKKAFEMDVSLSLTDDSGIDGLINPYCWANGLLKNNTVQYIDQNGEIYSANDLPNYQSSLTSDLRDQSDRFKQRKEAEWMVNLNPQSSFNNTAYFEATEIGRSVSIPIQATNNLSLDISYQEATVGTFLQGADVKVTKFVGTSNVDTPTKGEPPPTNSSAGTITTTTPGPHLPTQGNATSYRVQANYRLNPNWNIFGSWEKTTVEYNHPAEYYTSDCAFTPEEEISTWKLGFLFTY